MMPQTSQPFFAFPALTANGQARAAALAAAAKIETRPTSLVAYESKGVLLIIGPEENAVAAAVQLQARLHCIILVSEPAGRPARAKNADLSDEVQVVHEKLVQLTGHLGQFAAIVSAPPPQGGMNLLQTLATKHTHFDLVLDLNTPPILRQELLPFGYYAPADDPDALRKALEELPDMVGEFEKPKFFNYNPDICAHGSSGLTGCTRCIDVCPAAAIISMGEEIAVDPYLCQGGGVCATACPTGAITYVYPPAGDSLSKLRELLKVYRASGGTRPVVLFHDAERGNARVAQLAASLPEHVIPVEAAELGSVGMDLWLAALAYGASEVLLLATPAIPPSVREEMAAQLTYAKAILQGMGYEADRIRLVGEDDNGALPSVPASKPRQDEFRPATFASFDDKRTNIRLAVEHLYEQAPARQESVALPEGAPYGEIQVNRDACTLCMACVSICPTSALSDGQEIPQLNFHEANCVQCGLCRTACPEDAITLSARYLYDGQLRRTPRVLNEEQPFCCTVCAKPFATASMIEKMTEKLKGHWMFQGEALERIKMCEDCRVKAMYKSEKIG
jgi:ferredoxin